MNDCVDLIRPALDELAAGFEIERDDTGCRVVTPFQHPDGDRVRLWVETGLSDYLTVRDYGETYAMLRLYGVEPDTEKRSNRIDDIVHRFGLQPSPGEIKSRATPDKLAATILETIQAVQAVSYLIYTHQTGKATRFNTEVEGYLQSKEYDFTTNFEVAGRTKRTFDVAINHRHPGVLLDTIHSNNPNYLKQRSDVVLLNWYEIQDRDYRHGVIIDDVDGIYKESTLEGLEESLDYFFRWSDKEKIEREIPASKAT